MTKIESKHKTIKYSSETIFNFLSDFNNFEGLMPSKVSDWTSTKDSCYFSISGIANLGMKIAVNPLKDFLESLLEHLEEHKFEH